MTLILYWVYDTYFIILHVYLIHVISHSPAVWCMYCRNFIWNFWKKQIQTLIIVNSWICSPKWLSRTNICHISFREKCSVNLKINNLNLFSFSTYKLRYMYVSQYTYNWKYYMTLLYLKMVTNLITCK